MKNHIFAGAILLATANYASATLAEDFSSLLPSSDLERTHFPLEDLSYAEILAFFRTAGASDSRIQNMASFTDSNPLRLNRLKGELIELVDKYADSFNDSFIIDVPAIPVSIYGEDSYYEQINSFLVSVPQEIILAREHSDAQDGFNIPEVSLVLHYPPGIQAINSDGTLPGGTWEDDGNYDNTYRSANFTYKSTIIWVPVSSPEAAERFYDSATYSGTVEAWARNPGLVMSLSCEITLIRRIWGFASRMSSQGPSHRELSCSVVDMEFKYTSNSSTAFSMHWNGKNFTSDQVNITQQLPSTKPNIKSEFYLPWGAFYLPWGFKVPHCNENNNFTFRRTKSAPSLSFYYAGPKSRLPFKDQFKIKSTDNSFSVCTNQTEMVGKFIRLTMNTAFN